MTVRPTAASPLRLPALSHLMASAFVPGGAGSALATPASFVTLLPYALRGTIREAPDGDGMVLFGRYRPVLDSVLAVAVVLAGFALALAALVLGTALGDLVGLLIAVVLVILAGGSIAVGGVLLLVSSSASFTTSVGRETPTGRRWTLMALSQRPGTRLSALLLARRLVDTVPEGDVIVAVAGSPELAAGYERLGFTRGRGARMHAVAPVRRGRP